MSTSITVKTFLLYLLSQTITISFSLWFRKIGWYDFDIMVIIIPLVIISIIWPLYLLSNVEINVLEDVLKSSIAGICGIILSNFIMYFFWYFIIKNGDFSNLWGKDFDVLKVEIFLSLIIFIVLHLLFFLFFGKYFANSKDIFFVTLKTILDLLEVSKFPNDFNNVFTWLILSF